MRSRGRQTPTLRLCTSLLQQRQQVSQEGSPAKPAVLLCQLWTGSTGYCGSNHSCSSGSYGQCGLHIYIAQVTI